MANSNSEGPDFFDTAFGFSFIGVGLLMFTFAFLTFPPLHLIPHPAVSTFLALFGSIFCLGGAITLTYFNWFGKSWEAGNKGRVVALAIAAVIFAAALITFFTLSLGSYAQLFSDTFADHSGYKLYSQIALLVTGTSFAIGFVASLFQCVSAAIIQNKNSRSDASRNSTVGGWVRPSVHKPDQNLGNTTSISTPSTSAVSNNTSNASDAHSVSRPQ